MKPSIVLLALLATISPLAAQGCNLPDCHALGFVSVWDGNGGPFLSGHTYLVDVLTVPSGQTLTIQPGAIVKFSQSSIFRMDVYGTLDALGTAAQPIIFTSNRDDVGGDHNGDGGATVPAPGNWGGLNFYSSSTDCDLEWCEVRYTAQIAIEAYGPTTVPIDLRNVSTRFTAGTGLYLFDARPGTVDGCAFDDGQIPVQKVRYYEVGAFNNCTASGNTMGDTMRVDGDPTTTTIYGVRTWTPANTLNGTGVLLTFPKYTIHSTASLTLEAGMIIKQEFPQEFNVDGLLLCNGTANAPVIFTADGDDTAGGDSENDGPTTGQPGDVGRFKFSQAASASVLDWTEVRFTGVNGAVDTASFADITLSNCRFADSAGAGLVIGGSSPTVMNCAFENNVTAIAPVPIVALQNFSANTASGNVGGDIMALGTAAISGTATLSPGAAFGGTGTFVLRGTVTVSTGATLTIDPGVIIKGDPALPAVFQVWGTLDAGDSASASPVVFTSFHDDTHGGDSNNDGAATSPAAGDWSGLRFQFNSDASSLENAVVRYAGKGGSASVYLDHCDMTLDAVTIEFGAGVGMSANGSLPSCSGCAFDFCTSPLSDVDLSGLAGFAGCTAQGNTLGDVIRIGDANISTAITVQAANTLNATGVLVIDTFLSIQSTASLTLEAGTILKFSGLYDVNCSGTMQCNGTASQPVVLTSLNDDFFGGDSAGDGPTSGAPGDWGKLTTNFSPTDLVHTHVRFGGGNGALAAVIAGELDMTNVTIEQSASAGLDLQNNGGQATVTNSSFIGNDVPIVRAALTNLENFSGNTATGNAQGDVIWVNVPGSTSSSTLNIGTNNTMNGNGVVVIRGWINLWNATVVGPGVTFKFTSGRGIHSNPSSPLTANGTPGAPVVFTSIHDDAYGGADGDTTAPNKGDWVGLEFAFQVVGDSTLNGAIVRYAGAGGVPSIDLDDADVSFCDLVIEYGGGVALDASFNSSPVIKNPTFLNNCGTAVDGITWAVLANMTGVTANGNGPASGFVNATTITSDLVEGNLTIERDNYFGSCIVVTVSPDLAAGLGTLSFGRGVVVKCVPNVEMTVSGIHATAFEKTVFTSIKDDAVAGDTNGDGTASSAAPDDWVGIVSHYGLPTVEEQRIEHVLVRYADVGIDRALDVRASRAEYCDTFGFKLGYFDMWPFIGEAHNLVAFQNNGIGIQGGNMRNCTSVRNGTYGFNANKAVYCIAWNNGIDEYTYTSDTVLGPSGTHVIYSCGTTLTVGPPTGGPLTSPGVNCGSAGWGNVDVDPLFEDEINGNLRLSQGSPVRDYFLQPCPQSILNDTTLCKPWGLSGQGYPEVPATTRDFLDGSRPADGDLSGPDPFVADLGAYERRPHELLLFGNLQLGAPTVMAIGGPAGETGSAIYLVGLSGTDIVVPGWGVLHIDLNSILATQTLPLPAFYVINTPYLPLLAGYELDFQAIVLPDGQPQGSLSEIYRGRFHY